MRTINYEEYWAAVDEAPESTRTLTFAAFAVEGEIESFDEFVALSHDVLTPASVLVARSNGCQSERLAEYYDGIVEIARLTTGGDIGKLALTNETDQRFYAAQVEELEARFRAERRCHPESGGSLFVCYCR
jgi:hypothetical protein